MFYLRKEQRKKTCEWGEFAIIWSPNFLLFFFIIFFVIWDSQLKMASKNCELEHKRHFLTQCWQFCVAFVQLCLKFRRDQRLNDYPIFTPSYSLNLFALRANRCSLWWHLLLCKNPSQFQQNLRTSSARIGSELKPIFTQTF